MDLQITHSHLATFITGIDNDSVSIVIGISFLLKVQGRVVIMAMTYVCGVVRMRVTF
jgi:hypothetical protein